MNKTVTFGLIYYLFYEQCVNLILFLQSVNIHFVRKY